MGWYELDKDLRKYEDTKEYKQRELKELEKTIKDCPFCGNPVKLGQQSYGYGNYGSGTEVIIYCKNCRVKMIGPDTSWTEIYDHNDEIREFIKLWNTRKD